MPPPIDTTQPADRPERKLTVAGLDIDLVDTGEGPPVLLLHGIDGVFPASPFFRSLAKEHRVLAPWHPGSGHSETTRAFRTIHDLAIFYRHFLTQLDLDDVTLIGTGFGGWLATEIAAIGTERIGRLALIGTVGFKFSGPAGRDIADIYGLPFAEFEELEYADTENKLNKYTDMSDWEMWALARSRETVAKYGWKPYLHNPALAHWAGQIDVPVLVIEGAEDRVTVPEYGRKVAEAFPNGRLATINTAGHHPWHEQPDPTATAVLDFIAGTGAARTAA